MKKASKLQREVFEYIVDCLADNGKPPTYREIQAHLEAKSINTVCRAMDGLKEKEFVEVVKGRGGGAKVIK